MDIWRGNDEVNSFVVLLRCDGSGPLARVISTFDGCRDYLSDFAATVLEARIVRTCDPEGKPLCFSHGFEDVVSLSTYQN